ncbi:hypothetical protein I7I48_11645 [Histoplasma ohiense]|nr:hypothetical protein I7I48_11645 [Histoplasma ohiense (nom. inval.)]
MPSFCCSSVNLISSRLLSIRPGSQTWAAPGMACDHLFNDLDRRVLSHLLTNRWHLVLKAKGYSE